MSPDVAALRTRRHRWVDELVERDQLTAAEGAAEHALTDSMPDEELFARCVASLRRRTESRRENRAKMDARQRATIASWHPGADQDAWLRAYDEAKARLRKHSAVLVEQARLDRALVEARHDLARFRQANRPCPVARPRSMRVRRIRRRVSRSATRRGPPSREPAEPPHSRLVAALRALAWIIGPDRVARALVALPRPLAERLYDRISGGGR